MNKIMLKRFDHPDEVRHFEKGKFEIVNLGGMTLGRASYEPGWKWSEHVGAERRHTKLSGRTRRPCDLWQGQSRHG